MSPHPGYWTDNGAHYYYHTLPDSDYEETLLRLRDHFVREDIPVRYIQIDSWWYFKGEMSDSSHHSAVLQNLRVHVLN